MSVWNAIGLCWENFIALAAEARRAKTANLICGEKCFLFINYKESTEIYKRMLLENRDFTALNVFVALCYYKLDYYDVSLEILAVYLAAHPDSAVAISPLASCGVDG